MVERQAFPHLFAPLQVGPVEVPNRMYVTPHAAGYTVPDPSLPGFSLPADNVEDYYVERARGGVGLIIQGGTVVHPTSEYPSLWQLFSERAVESWAPIVEAVHQHGTKMFVQLLHGGHHADHFGQFGGPLSSSTVPPVEGTIFGMPYIPLSVPVREMTQDDIDTVVGSFGLCTRNALAAGYDGVELHASHSYLVEEFLSPFFNKRTDAYGGSLENRLRFLFECLGAMRAGAEGRLAVGVRLICDERLPGGLTTADMKDVATAIDGSGLVDFIDLDLGTYHNYEYLIGPAQTGEHWQVPAIAEVRAAIGRSVVFGCPGLFHDPAKGEELVADGVMDMVGGTRGFFADPELARKAEEGHPERIRPCIGLNMCVGGSGCVMNAANGLEFQFGVARLQPTTTPRRTLVIGGGPAGLEAARIAALRGHRVALWEKGPQLGGTLRLMAAMPGRANVLEAAEWWAAELARLDVDVRVETSASADAVLIEAPDVVILATGAQFDRTGATAFVSSPIPGWEQDFVRTPEEILGADVRYDGTVVVLDEEGGAPGVAVAHVLALRGAHVQLVSRHPAIAHNLHGWQLPFTMRRFEDLGVQVVLHTSVRSIGNHSVMLYDVHSDREWTVDPVSAVVMVTGRTAQTGLRDDLGSAMETHLIGDAWFPRDMTAATREGHRVAWDL